MKNLVISLVVLMTGVAHAESEVIYLPKTGQSAIKGLYSMGPNASFKRDSGAEFTLSGNLFNLDYMYGIDDGMSAGVALNSGSQVWDITGIGKTTYSGMGDLVLKMRMETGMWVYGADLGVPLANGTINGDTGNRSTGGLSVIPMVGLIVPNGTFNFGALASYNYLLDRKTENKGVTPATTSTDSGGSYLTLSPFAEWNYGAGFLMGQFSVYSYSDTTTKDANGVSTTSKATNRNALMIGGTYNFTQSLTGLAHYTLDMIAANSAQGSPAYNVNTIDAGVRFVF
jgi:predicted porin